MSKLIEHLQKHLHGEILTNPEARDYFATDGSVLRLPPKIVVYPRNTSDVRKATRFSWQLAEKGKKLPITPRGKGTDQAGGALGDGMMLVLPAHMNKLLDLGKDTVTVQPGMLYGDLQRTLHTHGRFLPPYPSSMEFSTLGGAVANNACGEKTLKYGSTADYVQSLEVVLANGQVVTVEPLTNKQLNKKKGQGDLEGQIYRDIDALITENADLIERSRPQVSKNSSGYALWDVKTKKGFDLTKLFVGSQGTLGTVTEITFRTEPYNPNTHLIVTYFDDIEKAGEAVVELQKLEPSAMEVVDQNLLDFIQRNQPGQLEGLIEGEIPALVLLVEFDNEKDGLRKRRAKKASKILKKHEARYVHVTTDEEEQDKLWKIRRSAAAVIWLDQGKKKALPVIEDGVVPVEKLPMFLTRVYGLFAKYDLEIAVWGHAGNANFHMQPFLDLGTVSDQQTMFRLMDDFYNMVIEMGGSTCGEHNDGRIRAMYLPALYGAEMYELFRQAKRICDPHNILNPGVKIDVTREDVKRLVRREYSMKHLYDHMPGGR